MGAGVSKNNMNENKLSTDELFALLFKEPSLPLFLQREATDLTLPSFNEYISALCEERNEVPEHVIVRANLEKSYGHRLFSGTRTPSRDTVLQFAFGFCLNVKETQELLKVARKSLLYPRVKRDSAIIYCLHNEISIVDTQIILHDLGLPLLGGGRRND